MAKQKYWKTTVTTTVLTSGDEAPVYDGLAAVAGDIDDGDAVGSVTYQSTEVTPATMRILLDECGSDSSFFEELDEDED